MKIIMEYLKLTGIGYLNTSSSCHSGSWK